MLSNKLLILHQLTSNFFLFFSLLKRVWGGAVSRKQVLRAAVRTVIYSVALFQCRGQNCSVNFKLLFVTKIILITKTFRVLYGHDFSELDRCSLIWIEHRLTWNFWVFWRYLKTFVCTLYIYKFTTYTY